MSIEYSNAMDPIMITISFRGQSFTVELSPNDFLSDVQSKLISVYSRTIGNTAHELEPSNIKLMYKGSILSNNSIPLYQTLSPSVKKPTAIRLLAIGQSDKDIEKDNLHSQQVVSSSAVHRSVKDDLTKEGQHQLNLIHKNGQKVLQKHVQRANRHTHRRYGFQRIQTLSMLPEEDQARDILASLSQDPGILACMARHQWTVGCLSEMYPEGKVGESEICIMGLNRNKGSEILLRLRTDDLQGFRKMTSIRKVLYHELAHNVYSEHDGAFFQLMRQIEKECVEMNWTQSLGHSLTKEDTNQQLSRRVHIEEEQEDVSFIGGVFRLGGGADQVSDKPIINSPRNKLSNREVRAQAAMDRWNLNIEQKCDENVYVCNCNIPHCQHINRNPK